MSRYSEVETHPKTHQESRHSPRWQERVSVDDALRQCTSGTASLLATKELPCREVPFTPELHNGLHRSLHPGSRSILSTLNSVGHPQQIGLHAAQTRMRRERPHPLPHGASRVPWSRSRLVTLERDRFWPRPRMGPNKVRMRPLVTGACMKGDSTCQF